MAEDSFQEKTEDPTAKRLDEARQEGNVPKSVEFNSVFILLFAIVSLYFISGQLLSKLSHGFTIFYQEIAHFQLTDTSLQYYALLGVKSMIGLILPFLLVVTIVGVLVNVVQVGFLFTPKSITPDIKRINPISGFKRYATARPYVDLIKGILKIIILAWITYRTLKTHERDFFLLAQKEIIDIVMFIGKVMFLIAMKTTAALFVLAVFDLIYQRRQYKKDLRMTKQQIKEEMKQAEGDPEIKRQIRSIQLSKARERMMDLVKEADVVITNPTHLAVALKYDTDTMSTPVVVAKGARLIAEKIKAIAKEHNIPVLENKPLARSLFKLCEVGAEIPFELFHAVAEIFAYVYQLKNKQ